MQSAETVLDVLRERGRRGLPLNKLYRLLFNPQLYLLAYGRIYSNKGAMTPGPDAETADGMTMGKRSGDIATQVSVSILRCLAAGFSRSGSRASHSFVSARIVGAQSSTPRDASASRAARSGAPATLPLRCQCRFSDVWQRDSHAVAAERLIRLSVRGSSAPRVRLLATRRLPEQLEGASTRSTLAVPGPDPRWMLTQRHCCHSTAVLHRALARIVQ